MKAVVTILGALTISMSASSMVLDQSKLKTISVSGTQATVLYQVLGGQGTGTVFMGGIDCTVSTIQSLQGPGFEGALGQEESSHRCDVDEGRNENILYLKDTLAARFFFALQNAGTPVTGDVKNGSLKVVYVTCQNGQTAQCTIAINK